MYEVIKDFTDAEDGHVYRAGHTYPHGNANPSDERIKSLASKDNKRNEVLIQSTETENEYPKHTGGGWYELSNGEKAQGVDAALKAEKALHE